LMRDALCPGIRAAVRRISLMSADHGELFATCGCCARETKLPATNSAKDKKRATRFMIRILNENARPLFAAAGRTNK
jgi:hypothetical protein